jgi:hypothetical protein
VAALWKEHAFFEEHAAWFGGKVMKCWVFVDAEAALHFLITQEM